MDGTSRIGWFIDSGDTLHGYGMKFNLKTQAKTEGVWEKDELKETNLVRCFDL